MGRRHDTPRLCIWGRGARLAVCAVLLTLAAPLSIPTAIGQEGAPPAEQLQREGPSDRAELEAFLDDLLAEQMEEHDIAGAAVSVVKDGELLLAKGYGLADVEEGTPVDPETTVFRVGSVGKVFTWTAVMQLVEQGKLDLDADVNEYLDFRIPDTYREPITLEHLMTHTSGFEDRHRGSAVTDPDDLISEREFLVSHMSARVRPPGVAGYSNYNAMLAGYIVARVSGQPYEQYVQEHVLNPLGMAHSTAQSPIPPALRPLASKGYTSEDGAFQEFPDYIAQPGGLPSGAHQATVTDMARFMIAHLEGGRYEDADLGEARILEEATAQRMQSTLYTADPRLLGTAYGTFDFTDNGVRTLGHIGYSPPMNGLLLLLPEEHLGVYVVYNSEGGGQLTNQHLGFQRAFFDHYYPAPELEPVRAPDDFAERAGRFTGSYRTTAGSETTIDKVGKLFDVVRINDPGDGTLLFSGYGLELRFAEVEPLYFRQVDGPFALVFREDDRGRVTHIFTDLAPQYAIERLSWYETTAFNLGLAAACLLLFLSMIPVAVIRLVRLRRAENRGGPAAPGARWAYAIILAVSVLNLLFVVGAALWGAQANVLAETSTIIAIVLGLGVIAAVLAVVAVAYTVLAWKDRYWGIAGRVHYTLVSLAALAFVWFLNFWNLLGWRY